MDSLPADQKPRGVVGATLVDPDAYQTVRAVMAADLAARQPTPKRQRSLSRSRLRGVLLEAVDSAGPEGVTVAEAAAALYGPAPTGTQVELARQALNRAVNRGLLRRIGGGRGGLARYVRGAVASAAAPDGRVGCADTPESAVAS
ncbi:hypothetical protein [Mycobacterium sp.]|uniref:hypothetical protein n=1 Tax=Mycobacterium sp. TaxID=1785 RepID=UPI0011FEF37A|nr:hypothetical protein [Mycobacterium sp.]TAM62855.1 MAG: hypothetical protein EPN51_28905 [Mycobacterium sp.]